MKKFYTIFAFISFLLVNNSVKAEDLKTYVGLSLFSNSSEIDNKEIKDAENFGISLNLGIKKFIINNFFIGVEGNLNLIPILDIKGSYWTSATHYVRYEESIHQLLNVKGIFGYAFNENFSIFGVAGITLNDYYYKKSGLNLGVAIFLEQEETEMGEVFGLGAAYELNDKYQLTLSYEVTSFELEIDEDEIETSNVKFGVNYNF